MKQKCISVLGLICGLFLALFPPVSGGGSLLFFGELPIPEEE